MKKIFTCLRRQEHLSVFILFLAIILAVSGCGKKSEPIAEQPAPEKSSGIGEVKNVTSSSDVAEIASSTDEIDTSNWKTYRNEEYGFELKYPEEWNIFNKSVFSKADQEESRLEMGFTYEKIIEGIEPRDNMVPFGFVVEEYQKNYFENLKHECSQQKTCGDNCELGITCYNLQEISIDHRDAIKSNYVGLSYGNPIGESTDIKLGKNKILHISGVIEEEIDDNFSKDVIVRIEKETRCVKKILSTVKFID